MPFSCPYCAGDMLEVLASIELPADSRSDEITLQVIECSGCGFAALAVYQESRRGALDRESWEHIGYRAGSAEVVDVLHAIRSCPEPANPACSCPAHQHLGRQNANGTWNGLDGIEIQEVFNLR